VGGKNVSVAWCQPIGLLQVAGWRGVSQSVVTSLPAHRYQQHWCHYHLTRLPTTKYWYNDPEPSTWTRICPNVNLSTTIPHGLACDRTRVSAVPPEPTVTVVCMLTALLAVARLGKKLSAPHVTREFITAFTTAHLLFLS